MHVLSSLSPEVLLLSWLQEMLARHLETIEADMVEREAAFAQLQRDRDTIEKVTQLNCQFSITRRFDSVARTCN